MSERIAVIGLGYVGLPVAVGMARAHGRVIGFDIDRRRIEALKQGVDATGEIDAAALTAADLDLTADASTLAGCTAFIVTVPTPIDANRQPDLGPLRAASETVGRALRPGGLAIFESTVYPGVTEEICAPILERASGLRLGPDFALGYSPERINPGDAAHRLETITKVIAASDEAALERLAFIYGEVVEAGLHRAPSIRTAEAAKVIENTQRDLNIALMNELALIFDRLGLRTQDVLAAARTKWNFLPFAPGLVGGHCIGVDPYYLTAKAEALGYHPEIILAGRRINDGMAGFIARKCVKLLIAQGVAPQQARVGVLGLTFKENVPDLRNSQVPSILEELESFGIEALIHDPHANAEDARTLYGIGLRPLDALEDLDALILAVPHSAFGTRFEHDLPAMLKPNALILDVKSALDPTRLPDSLAYWSL